MHLRVEDLRLSQFDRVEKPGLDAVGAVVAEFDAPKICA
jgi:hypothetical protein